MAEQDLVESQPRGARDGVTDEIMRLLKLVRRLEHENASLRRELAVARPLAA
jgi:molybdenum-dependent DNA-binding transcriptional regulator ModE